MKISMIVAMGENRAIGKDGGMPWHVPADLKYFRQVTMGKPVIMGRRTFESIGKPLPGRTNIVVSGNPDFRPEGVIVVPDPKMALEEAARAEGGQEEIMVIGGASLYEAFMKVANRVYITELHDSFKADTYFPSLGFGWEEVSRETREADEKNPVACSFVVLEKSG